MGFSCLVCKTHTDHQLLRLVWRLREITAVRTGQARCSVTHVLSPHACLPYHCAWDLFPQEAIQRSGRKQRSVSAGMCPFTTGPADTNSSSSFVLTFPFPWCNSSGHTPHWATNCL